MLLPVSDQLQDAQEEVNVEIVKGTGTILVVDDEEILRNIAAESLSRLGYQTILAENGRQGLELYKAHRDNIDLVLLDMIMPVLNGRDCLEELRKINPDVRVVIVSGYSKDKELTRLQEKFDFGFLVKPYNISVLSRVLARALEKVESSKST
jgi:CheY-like chemotaxis protein